MESMPDVLQLADWRRRVFHLYSAVRLSGDAETAWRAWRQGRDELFRSHPQSPIPPEEPAGFTGLHYFGYDPAARVVASVEQVAAESWAFDASEGTLTLDRVGRVSFDLFGESLTLDLYWFRSYGGGLFLSFRDATSGTLTYGGCRYLLDTVKGADLGMTGDGLVLDFNFAYQPSCAYDPRWVCPLAPPGNRLAVEIRAGERLPERGED